MILFLNFNALLSYYVYVIYIFVCVFVTNNKQGDHLYVKPGSVRDFTKSQGNVREKLLWEKSGLKLFIVSCIF